MKQTEQPHIVVMGVGNILLRDEGAGVRAMQHLESSFDFPENVDLIDGGVLGLNLMGILSGADHVILLDCVRGGGAPGDIYIFDYSEIPPRVTYKDSLHQVDFVETMSVLPLHGKVPQTTVIGVEPKTLEAYAMELSPQVAAAIPEISAKTVAELEKLGAKPRPKESPTIVAEI